MHGNPLQGIQPRESILLARSTHLFNLADVPASMPMRNPLRSRNAKASMPGCGPFRGQTALCGHFNTNCRFSPEARLP
jgi:hypothetical protein